MSEALTKLKIVLKENERKNIFTMAYQFLRSSIREKEIGWHYFTRLLYRTEIENYLDYIGIKKGHRIYNCDAINDSSLRNILDNKLTFNNHLEDKAIRIPKMIAYNFNNKLFFNNKIIKINNYEDFKEVMKEYFETEKSVNLFAKPIMGMKGIGCFEISQTNINEEMFNVIHKNNYIFQESIMQHDELNKIFPYSVNTIRVFTYIGDNDKTYILPPFMTFYCDDGDVTNDAIFVNLDIDTGELSGYGYNNLEYGGNKFKKHPNTDFKFEGFKVPYFQECKELVIEATNCIPYKLIGWDVAISQDGPLIIEGNGRGSMGSFDMAYGGLKKNPIFREILKKCL